jgi:hypothetical protein
MIVSTLFGQNDPPRDFPVVRRGYRLHVTNLEDRAFTYLVRFRVTPPSAEPRWASVLNQFFDISAGLYGGFTPAWVQTFRRTGNVYVGGITFTVEAGQTVSAVCAANANLDPPDGVTLLEGYVTIEVPVLRNDNDKAMFRAFPQAMGPVKVLLNPETTMTHKGNPMGGGVRDMDGYVRGHVGIPPLDFDTVEPLIVATGKAENEITPNGNSVLRRDALIQTMAAQKPGESSGLEGTDHLPAADRMRLLLELLCDLDTNDKFVAELNKVLNQNEATARICRPKG